MGGLPAVRWAHVYGRRVADPLARCQPAPVAGTPKTTVPTSRPPWYPLTR